MLLHNPTASKAQVLIRLMAFVGGVIRQKIPCTGLPCSVDEALRCDPWSWLYLPADPPLPWKGQLRLPPVLTGISNVGARRQ